MITRDCPVGTFPDVAWHVDRWWMVQDEGSDLVVRALAPGGTEIGHVVRALGAPVGLPFPRLWSDGTVLWLAYRECTGDERIVVGPVSGLVTTLTPAVGNHPVALGCGYVAWQDRDTRRILRLPLSDLSATPTDVGPWCPVGLSRILASGAVVTMDDDNGSQPGMTRPCYAGQWVVGEQRMRDDEPLQTRLALLDRARQLGLHWDDGRLAKTPRMAVASTGHVAVVTWGDRAPVRLLLVDVAEVTRDGAIIPDPHPERERDVMPYLVGDLSDTSPDRYPHAGPHTWDLVTDPRQKLITMVLGSDPQHTQVWRYDDTWVYLHWDGHKGQHEHGYTFTDGRWLRRMMRVGEVVECSSNQLVRLSWSGEVVDRHPLGYETRLVGRYLAYPCGRIGMRPAIEWRYELGPNYREVNLHAGGWGLYQWRSERRLPDGSWTDVDYGPPIDQLAPLEARVVPAPPPLPTVTYPVTLRAPGIEVLSDYPCVLTGRGMQTVMEWRDRNNEGAGGRVFLRDHSVHLELRNQIGLDTTGASRPVVFAPEE